MYAPVPARGARRRRLATLFTGALSDDCRQDLQRRASPPRHCASPARRMQASISPKACLMCGREAGGRAGGEGCHVSDARDLAEVRLRRAHRALPPPPQRSKCAPERLHQRAPRPGATSETRPLPSVPSSPSLPPLPALLPPCSERVRGWLGLSGRRRRGGRSGAGATSPAARISSRFVATAKEPMSCAPAVTKQTSIPSNVLPRCCHYTGYHTGRCPAPQNTSPAQPALACRAASARRRRRIRGRLALRRQRARAPRRVRDRRPARAAAVLGRAGVRLEEGRGAAGRGWGERV